MASQPFSPKERDLILAEATKMEVMMRIGNGRFGSPEIMDSSFMLKTCIVLLYTGVHISKLPKLKPDKNVFADPNHPDDLLIGWRRPKNSKNIPGFPVHPWMRPFVRDFLGQDKPQSRGRYNQLLDELELRLAQNGNTMCAGPLRFRHHCGVWMLYELGLRETDVMTYLGVTRETLETYISRPYWMRNEDMRTGIERTAAPMPHEIAAALGVLSD